MKQEEDISTQYNNEQNGVMELYCLLHSLNQICILTVHSWGRWGAVKVLREPTDLHVSICLKDVSVKAIVAQAPSTTPSLTGTGGGP